MSDIGRSLSGVKAAIAKCQCPVCTRDFNALLNQAEEDCMQVIYLTDKLEKAEAERDRAILDFVERVERRAEDHMLKTGKLEGAHYAAMKELAKAYEVKKGGDNGPDGR